jgi:hypothetical protein
MAWAIINGVPPERSACLKLQEVAFKALKAEKAVQWLPVGKGLDLLSLRRRLLTAKSASTGPNVTILKLLHRASIGKVDGLTGLAGTVDNEEIAQTIRALGNSAGRLPRLCSAFSVAE